MGIEASGSSSRSRLSGWQELECADGHAVMWWGSREQTSGGGCYPAGFVIIDEVCMSCHANHSDDAKIGPGLHAQFFPEGKMGGALDGSPAHWRLLSSGRDMAHQSWEGWRLEAGQPGWQLRTAEVHRPSTGLPRPPSVRRETTGQRSDFALRLSRLVDGTGSAGPVICISTSADSCDNYGLRCGRHIRDWPGPAV